MPHEGKYTVIRILILSVITLFLQIYFIPLVEIIVWRPDLIVLLILYIGYSYGVVQGTLAGFILGVFQDSLSPIPIGISSLANCIVGFLAGQARQLKLSYNAKILLSILLILVQGSLFFLLYQFKTEATYFYLLVTRVFPNTLYTFLIGLLISLFFRPRYASV
jgi:rod shape-determining protein MreD